MTAADDLKDKILDLANAYEDITTSKSANADASVDPSCISPQCDGIVKSHILNYPHRRYYVDLKRNARGYFLRVTMLSTSARVKLAIPAEGMRDLYNSIYKLLGIWWIPAPEKNKNGSLRHLYICLITIIYRNQSAAV